MDIIGIKILWMCGKTFNYDYLHKTIFRYTYFFINKLAL